MPSAIRKTLAGALTFAVLAVSWYVLAPPQLGGSTRYAVVHGTSMEPRFHRGDLVLLRTASEYRVGDIAAYQSPELGRTVMHRIVRKAGDRYQFKGDNNDFLDSPAPQRVELAGKHWLRIPAAGNLLGMLRTPVVAALIAGLLALLVAGGGAKESRRRRRRTRDSGAPGPPARCRRAAAAGSATSCARSTARPSTPRCSSAASWPRAASCWACSRSRAPSSVPSRKSSSPRPARSPTRPTRPGGPCTRAAG